jgi:hypothetical protein
LFISTTQQLVGLCLSFPMHYTLGEKMVKGAKCRNPSLGLATEARGCKVAGQEGDLGALHMLPGVQRV